MEVGRAVALDASHLRKLQLELLGIYKEFDRICRAAHIPYFMSGGTLLGAVRHHGFVPWDDDMDVEMLRPHYDRFCEVVDEFIDHDRFFFQHTGNDMGYRWVYGKLRRKGTAYVRTGQSVIRQKTGLCIDVFPLDEGYEDWWQSIVNGGCYFCRKILWSPVGARQSASFGKRLLFRTLSLVPRNWALACHRRLAVRAADLPDKTGPRYIMFHSEGDFSGKRYRYERAWFDGTVEMEFEGCKFLAPRGYDGVLRVNYEDSYMEIPPPQDRHGHVYAERIRFSDGEELCAEGGT